MDSEQIEQIQHWIEEAVAPLRMAIEAQSAELEQLVKKAAELQEQIDNLDDNTPGIDHYHDEYASVDHVGRSEQSFDSRLSRLQDEINNVEYQVRDVERKAERAQSIADSASRNSGRGYY